MAEVIYHLGFKTKIFQVFNTAANYLFEGFSFSVTVTLILNKPLTKSIKK